MSTDYRGEDFPHLIQQLIEQPYRFTFPQSVFLLEKYAASVGKETPIGHFGDLGPASEESVRLRPALTFMSQIADIESVEPPQPERDAFQLTTTFLGLYGPNSPLPDFYTQSLIQADQERRPYAREFLDLFHHCLLSLFYRCELRYRYDIQYVREGRDELSSKIRALIGIGTENPPINFLRYTKLLAQYGRAAKSLQLILSDYFKLPISIEQFVGKWIHIHPTGLSRIGKQNCRIGVDFLIGERVYDRSGTFRLSVHLQTYEQYESFLPNGDNFRALKTIVDLFQVNPLRYELELILPAEVPPSNLLGRRIGYDSWIGSPPTRQKMTFPVGVSSTD
jgi:type VI secretion system protein ImpH